MDNYGEYNDPFSTNDDLDKMARELNNSKKKVTRQVIENMNAHAMSTCVGMDCMMDPANSRFAPPNLGANLGSDYRIFPMQGNFKSGLPTPIHEMREKKESKKRNKMKHEEIPKFGMLNDSDMSSNATDSVFTASSNNSDIESSFLHQTKFKPKKKSSHIKNFGSDFSDSSSDQIFDPSYGSQFSDISSFSSLPQKIKKKIKNESPHLLKYKDDNEKDIFGHISKCDECKNQLTDLLKTVVSNQEQINNSRHVHNENENHNKQNYINKKVNMQNQQYNQNSNNIQHDNSQIFGMNTFELKDMLILLLIGIFIIIFIDMFVRR